ncbi:MAG: hypothetical protein P9M03_05820 [Candidatus Theseobacter exili]|nr:hypothetical protein [Candidatus Theseobacter exili]
MKRHKKYHLPKALKKAKEVKEVAQADSLLDQVKMLQTKSLSIMKRAEREGDLRIALTAIREARGNLELLAKLMGEIETGQQVVIQVMVPQIIQILMHEIKDVSLLKRISRKLESLEEGGELE